MEMHLGHELIHVECWLQVNVRTPPPPPQQQTGWLGLFRNVRIAKCINDKFVTGHAVQIVLTDFNSKMGYRF